MTANRRSKHEIRSRMAQTGEKYTQARRAVVAPGGGGGGTGEDPGDRITGPEDSLGWFTDGAYNAILLADDEARMLSHPRVDPEHLLLAAARDGRVQWLLADEGIHARAIHDVIVAIRGPGDRLELRPRRSPASEQVLRRAVIAAAARGNLWPSTPELLTALGEHEPTARILARLGITDTQALVDSEYPARRRPADHTSIERRAAQIAASSRKPPKPGPIPPIFERFTWQARDAINTAIEYARTLDAPRVEPAHLLYGVLTAKAGVAATVRTRYGWQLPPAQTTKPGFPLATDIFTHNARRIVAEDMLMIAERLNHRALTTGHLLIATLEHPGENTSHITSELPSTHEITAAVIGALPAHEHT